jgi:hypothetical protein
MRNQVTPNCHADRATRKGSSHMSLTQPESIPQNAPYRGHAHFWERAMARRQFIRATAGSTAAVLGAGLAVPVLAHDAPATTVLPNPIPGGQQFAVVPPTSEFFHVLGPGPNTENATITDFDGALAAAHILGTATEIQGATVTPGLLLDGDLRFMQGLYVGVDGRRYQGTFGFF